MNIFKWRFLHCDNFVNSVILISYLGISTYLYMFYKWFEKICREGVHKWI